MLRPITRKPVQTRLSGRRKRMLSVECNSTYRILCARGRLGASGSRKLPVEMAFYEGTEILGTECRTRMGEIDQFRGGLPPAYPAYPAYPAAGADREAPVIKRMATSGSVYSRPRAVLRRRRSRVPPLLRSGL